MADLYSDKAKWIYNCGGVYGRVSVIMKEKKVERMEKWRGDDLGGNGNWSHSERGFKVEHARINRVIMEGFRN